MSAPSIRPCAQCLDGGDPVLMTYDHGWKHVECFDCDQLGPGAGSRASAIRGWNETYGRPRRSPREQGEEWARDKGPVSHLEQIDEAIALLGYGLDSPEAREFAAGAEDAIQRVGEGL